MGHLSVLWLTISILAARFAKTRIGLHYGQMVLPKSCGFRLNQSLIANAKYCLNRSDFSLFQPYKPSFNNPKRWVELGV